MHQRMYHSTICVSGGGHPDPEHGSRFQRPYGHIIFMKYFIRPLALPCIDSAPIQISLGELQNSPPPTTCPT